ncbi:MAG: hypothetical protein AB1714_00765 [Acidobacteriota bacterium]
MSFWPRVASWRPFRYLWPEQLGHRIARQGCRQLSDQLSGAATDAFVDLLLVGMQLFLRLWKPYRRNIKGFRGRYLFRTVDDRVRSGVVFDNERIMRHPNGIEDWDVRVSFKNVPALRSFLFSRDQDILSSLLRNEVEIDGNLNYVYKFAFMARDLGKELGLV